jgi:hypothetical protein
MKPTRQQIRAREAAELSRALVEDQLRTGKPGQHITTKADVLSARQSLTTQKP